MAGKIDLTNTEIRRRSPIPMHEQVRDSLLNSIAQNRLVAGDPLPSEFELCDMYGVSRTVVRQALLDLASTGAVQRVQGKGTFVAESRTSESFVHTSGGLHEEGAARGVEVLSIVRALDLVPAPITVAQALGVQDGSEVTYLERLRFFDETPWCVTHTYLPPDCLPLLRRADLATGSLYQALTDHDLRPGSAVRSIEAGMPSGDLARDLELPTMVPVLVVRSTGYLADGKPIEHYIAWHRGDRTRFEIEV